MDGKKGARVTHMHHSRLNETKLLKAKKAKDAHKKKPNERETVSFIFMVNDHIEISIQFILFNFLLWFSSALAIFISILGHDGYTIHETIRECAVFPFSLDFKAYVITTEITHIKCIRQSQASEQKAHHA